MALTPTVTFSVQDYILAHLERRIPGFHIHLSYDPLMMFLRLEIKQFPSDEPRLIVNISMPESIEVADLQIEKILYSREFVNLLLERNRFVDWAGLGKR